MALVPSRSPDITESLPYGFSYREGAQGSGPGTGAGTQFAKSADILVNDLPFRLAITNNQPYQRQSAPLSKQQLDTSKEAGEQTLLGWWTRSQASWHQGAGAKFYEPGSDASSEYRYASSTGVDVWTQGQVSLLKRMVAVAGSEASATRVSTWLSGAGDGAVLVNSSGLRTLSAAGTVSALKTVGVNATRACVRGSNAWIGYQSGIYRVDLTNLATASAAVASQASGASPVPYYAKSRLIVARGQSLFEVPPAPSSVVNLDTATPIFTHPLPDWRWTGVADGPRGIFASGYSPGYGAVYELGLDTSGATMLPTINSAMEVSTFPAGEEVHSMISVAGSYLAYGTNKGIRVAVLGNTYANAVTYGPLIVETTSPVTDLTARDRFVYGAVTSEIDGQSGAVRIDIGQEIIPNSMRYPWAWDAQTHTSETVSSVAFIGASDRLVMGGDLGAYLQSATLYEESGHITTGGIRFATTELKQFQLARVAASTFSGSIGLSTVGRTGIAGSIVNYGPTMSPDGDVRISSPIGPQELLSFQLDLFAGSSGTESPIVRSLVIKALPAPGKRQRMIQLPLYCTENELDAYGNAVHGIGYTRLVALEALESQVALVQVTDRRTGESFSGVIEQITYTGTQPPTRQEPRFDGIVVLTIRAV